MQHYLQENTPKLQKPSFLLCSRGRKRMWYETESKMSMVAYAFCVMNNNIDYSLVLYIRTIRCYKKTLHVIYQSTSSKVCNCEHSNQA